MVTFQKEPQNCTQVERTMKIILITTLSLVTTVFSAVDAQTVPFPAAVELTETLQLPECHSIGWVQAWVKSDPHGLGKGLDGVLDEAKWGTPSPQQLVSRNWDWKITDDQWREAVNTGRHPRRLPSSH